MYEKIPETLKNEKSWVNTMRVSKMPMMTDTRRAASASDSSTWGTFEDAVANVKDHFYDGIGYVFHDAGIVGIDIDCGFEDGLLSMLAIDVISACRSYCEKSRSGRGFHIFLRGDLPFPGKNNRNGLEIYKDARYFIMTGKQQFFTDIVENQEAIDYILTRYFSEAENDDMSEERGRGGRYYDLRYKPPQNGKISLSPSFPVIPQGTRNFSLLSFGGQLERLGYKADSGIIFKGFC